MKRPRYVHLALTVDAYKRCLATGNEWAAKHREWLETEAKDGPSGSGIDRGTTIDLDASTGERLIFHLEYHHMNDVGMYDGWTEHTLTVTPSLMFGLTLRFSGRNRNEVKDYLHEVYQDWLTEETEG